MQWVSTAGFILPPCAPWGSGFGVAVMALRRSPLLHVTDILDYCNVSGHQLCTHAGCISARKTSICSNNEEPLKI